MYTSFEISKLRSLRCASIDANASYSTVRAEGVGDLEDLLGQLSGRRKNENDRTVSALERRLMLQVNHAG